MDKELLSLYICCYLLAKLCPLFVTPWTLACQAPLFMGFPRQEYKSSLPFPYPWNLPYLGSELTSPAWQGRVFTNEPPGKPIHIQTCKEINQNTKTLINKWIQDKTGDKRRERESMKTRKNAELYEKTENAN